MSTRHGNGPHYEGRQRAAELNDLASHAAQSAAETPAKQDHPTGQEQSRRVREHSPQPSGQASPNAVNEHSFTMFGHEDIAVLAHGLWQARGCPEGSPEEDWFQAARDLRARKENLQK